MAVALAPVLLVGVATVTVAAPSTVVQIVWGPLSFNAGMAPKVLPMHEMAPVKVAFSARLAPFSELPPTLTQLTVDLDRNGAIDATGLPICARKQLRAASAENARRICRKAIVGVGEAHIAVPTSPRIRIPLTLFNAGVKGSVTTVLVHGVVPVPTPTPTIATIKIQRIDDGRFGLRSVATIPPIAAGEGALRDFAFTIERRFMLDGRERSFATARCRDGRLEARVASFTLSTGESSSIPHRIQACTSREGSGTTE